MDGGVISSKESNKDDQPTDEHNLISDNSSNSSGITDLVLRTKFIQVIAMIQKTEDQNREFSRQANELYKQKVKKDKLIEIHNIHTALADKAKETKKRAQELFKELNSSDVTSVKMEGLKKIEELMQSLYDDAKKGFEVINDLKIE